MWLANWPQIRIVLQLYNIKVQKNEQNIPQQIQDNKPINSASCQRLVFGLRASTELGIRLATDQWNSFWLSLKIHNGLQSCQCQMWYKIFRISWVGVLCINTGRELSGTWNQSTKYALLSRQLRERLINTDPIRALAEKISNGKFFHRQQQHTNCHSAVKRCAAA